MTRSDLDFALLNRLLVGAREVRSLKDRLVADGFLWSKEDKAVLEGLILDAEDAAGRLMLRTQGDARRLIDDAETVVAAE